MSEINRAAMIGGPGIVTWKSTTLHHKGAVTLTPNLSLFDIDTERSGVIDRRVDDLTHTCKLTPAGAWSDALIALLFPYLNPVVGSHIYGATAYPLVVTGITHTTGNVLTLKDAAITKMPTVTLSAGKTLLGEAEWTGLRGDGVAWSTDNGAFDVGSNGSPGGTDIDHEDIITQPYNAVWGSHITDLETESGWTIEFETSFEPRKTDRQGTINMVLQRVAVMAKCVPVNVSAETLMDKMSMQGTDMARGVSVRARSADLAITGPGVAATIHNAALVRAGYRFGGKELRTSEIGFTAVRSYSVGLVYGALCTLSEGGEA